MKITRKTLKNANITIVADKLHTSFLSPSLFSDFLPNPLNLIQIPPFGLMDFGPCNFIVDVDNRRVVINHKAGDILQSFVPKMAVKFRSEVKGPDIIAVGFNFLMELTCDSEFGPYSINEFLNTGYKSKFGDNLLGIGIKAFMKDPPFNSVFFVEPHITEKMLALANANFHCDMPDLINIEDEFINRYNKFEECINGIFK